MIQTQYLPQFGFPEAISYLNPSLKGFAPVTVLQLVNTGVTQKTESNFQNQLPNYSYLGGLYQILIRIVKLVSSF